MHKRTKLSMCIFQKMQNCMGLKIKLLSLKVCKCVALLVNNTCLLGMHAYLSADNYLEAEIEWASV